MVPAPQHAPSRPPASELLSCLAAFGPALEGDFQPQRFIEGLSAELRAAVPHDLLSIAHLAENGRSFSIFADQGTAGVWPRTERYTTDVDAPDRFRIVDWPLKPVFDGEPMCISDLQADSRLSGHAEELRAAGLRSGVFAPLLNASRVIGAVGAVCRVAGAQQAVHVERLCNVGRLIGPFVETIALLYRDRRRRHRVGRLVGITNILGATLHISDIIVPLGEAVRPAIAFDAMGVIMLDTSRSEWAFFGTAGEPPVGGIERISAAEFSYGEALMAGRVVLFLEAAKQLDPDRAGDRVMLGAGLESCLWVPMQFGEKVGGSLFFGKHEPCWYDSVDVDVAMAIASQLVLGIQHQRLADEQRRLASVERRAQTLEQSLKTARGELHQRYAFEQIIGRSPALRDALTQAALVAPTDTTVLLTGESGTGKELVAAAIHYASPRAVGPFVAINCAALPDTLLESELFGHERGAFTGADRLKRGRFEVAAGGTLLLDEIGELAPAVQAKLLRILQERQYERLGGTATLKVDLRVIAATNRDLERAVTEGRFREDLYYRLAVFRVHLPALRDRGDDVLLLADHFVRELGAKMGRFEPGLSHDARDLLLAHSWPGNIRELQNAIERALILAQDELISAEHLGIVPRPSPGVSVPVGSVPDTEAPSTALTIAEQEKRMIVEALRRTKGNKARAAAALGLSPTRLLRRIRRFGIDA